MEHCGGTLRWNIAVEHCGGTLRWNIAVEHCGGTLRWNIAVEHCGGTLDLPYFCLLSHECNCLLGTVVFTLLLMYSYIFLFNVLYLAKYASLHVCGLVTLHNSSK